MAKPPTKRPAPRKPAAVAVQAAEPARVVTLSDVDAERLHRAAWTVWGMQGEEELTDSTGRAWSVVASRHPPGLAITASLPSAVEGEADAVASGHVGQATLGAVDAASAAVAAAIQGIADRLGPGGPA